MKLLPLAVLSCAVLLAPVSVRAQTSLQQVLSDAQTSMMRGDLPAAKKGFQTVLQADPRNQTAIAFLRQIQVKEAQAPQGNTQEKQLSTVIIPKVEFAEATLGSAIDSLRQSLEKASGGRQSVNFVINLPEEVKMKTVSLKLSNIPFTEVLRYLGELANLNFEYDKYAVKVTPKGGVAANAAPAAPAPVVPGAQ